MPVIERGIFINAPVEKVFAIEDDPTCSPKYVPRLVRVTEVVQTPQRIGDSFRATYNFFGARFTVKETVREWEKNERIVVKMEGGLGHVFTGTYRLQENGTRVTWRIEYTVKGGVMGKVVNKLLVEWLWRWMNKRYMERGLKNLKTLCEAT